MSYVNFTKLNLFPPPPFGNLNLIQFNLTQSVKNIHFHLSMMFSLDFNSANENDLYLDYCFHSI